MIPRTVSSGWLLLMGFLFIISACNQKKVQPEIPEVDELKEFDVLVSLEDQVLAEPSFITFDDDSNLFVYDAGLEKALRINRSGEVVGEIGRQGSGPGEFQSVSNIYAVNNYLYLVDDSQYLIHRYDTDGELHSSINYGEFGTHRINKPYVTKEGDVLIPPTIADQAIFNLVEWNGEKISEIGEVPEGNSFNLDYDVYRDEISSQSVPSYFYSHVFAVSDDVEPNEYFLIYEAFPKVAKYNSVGERLWETTPTHIREIDSISSSYYEMMETVLRKSNAVRPLRYYVHGVSDDSNLYLITRSSSSAPLWIHRYNSKGKLIRRFKISSDVELLSQVDIDLTERQIFVVTNEAEIRAYSF